MEYPFIFGTAGHIDHGKTALVRAITGIDCDRMEEEKRRGITIELGFAPLTLANGKTVSIIDVPGHERFIRQMTAGAAGIDAAILVIAANEGVMPQTREHLDILNILGVRFGFVVLTKKDLADDETLDLAVEEAVEVTRATCMEGAPIIPVSSSTGEGISRVVEEIMQITDKIPPRKGFGAFFLPIDRVFGKKGLGSVVTGTCYQGSVSAGDEVVVMPSGIVGKARSLQTHGTIASRVQAGQRTAINLASVSHDKLERGDAVCAKGAFIATRCMDVCLDILPSAPKGVTHWQRVRLHAGTADVTARISLLKMDSGKKKSSILPGSGGPAQILTESDIAVAAGQRFVIRFYSPLVTIGGGRIMLPNAETVKGRAEREAKVRIIEELSGDFGPEKLLAAIVRDKGVLNASSLFALSQMEKKAFEERLGLMSAALEEYGLLEFGAARNFISEDAFDALARSMTRILTDFHAKYPERAGIDVEKLYAATGGVRRADKLAPADFKELISVAAARNIISPVEAREKTCYRATGHSRSPDKKFLEFAERVMEECETAGFNLLKLPELEKKLSAAGCAVLPVYMKRVTAYLRENGRLSVLEGGLLFPLKTRNRIIEALSSMNCDITVASLRDSVGVNRKYSLAMLDFLDSQGITRRIGDKRVLIARSPPGKPE
ncbi:MAG: selenocysteine-specific translation elongation factor [Spirochaetaceae bacterium]|jgi:selenocysteine-specific elongation factor|nr:selenocysteine-specific translation elongation factor [Spirochaetaceae bacterium]